MFPAMSETASQSQLNTSSEYRLDVAAVRRDFPILDIQVGKKPLVYLDSAATAQKPQQMTDTVQRYYMMQNANIHRGVHYLSQSATDAYEESRRKIARFFNAATPNEIVFVRGTKSAAVVTGLRMAYNA